MTKSFGEILHKHLAKEKNEKEDNISKKGDILMDKNDTRVAGVVVTVDEIEVSVATKRGKAIINIAVDFPIRLEVGDQVEFEDMDFFIDDGVVISMLDEKTNIIINGWKVNFKDLNH